VRVTADDNPEALGFGIEIEFDPNPKPGKRGRHPIDLDASTVIFLLMGFAVLVRVVAALAGTDRP